MKKRKSISTIRTGSVYDQREANRSVEKGLERLVKSREFAAAMGITPGQDISLTFLAQGEYNRNYVFINPTDSKRYVLRVNLGSQIQRQDQILYEYHALELLKSSGRTPLPVWADNSGTHLPYGVLVETFLPGRKLVYETDLVRAAQTLADIHSTPAGPTDGLIHAANGLRSIQEECGRMFAVYEKSGLADRKVSKRIRSLLMRGEKTLDYFDLAAPYLCCINTELNNGNFLIDDTAPSGKDTWLVDWEKPLYGEPAQDLGHFLAPTTTFWKTDVRLTPAQTEGFVREYIRAVDGRFDVRDLRERTDQYIRTTCLRGITWCAMAWVKYRQKDTLLKNQDTAKKLDEYLSDAFLTQIEEFLAS